MPISYVFKDSKTADNVAKTLLFVAKFNRKQAMVKFSEASVSVIWGGSPKTYFIHAEPTALDMFKNRAQLRHYGIDHCTIIQTNPTTLGKTIKGVGNQGERTVTVMIQRPNRIKICVEYVDCAKRTVFHSLPCEMKTLDDYKSALIEEIEQNVCRYDTRSFVDNIHRFKHIVDSFVKLNTPKIYISSKQSVHGNNLTINTRTQGSNVHISLSDLENGFSEIDDDYNKLRREEAGVSIDTKKLAFFLSSLVNHKRSKVCFEIEHNKCLKITLDYEITQGEKVYQSLLLLHSLNS